MKTRHLAGLALTIISATAAAQTYRCDQAPAAPGQRTEMKCTELSKEEKEALDQAQRANKKCTPPPGMNCAYLPELRAEQIKRMNEIARKQNQTSHP